MMFLLTMITVLFTAFGLYRIAQAALCLPSGKAVEALRNTHGKRGLTQKLEAALLPLAKVISRFLPMSEYRQRRLRADFLRLNIKQIPQKFTAKQKAKAMLLAANGMIFIALGIPALSLLTAVAALLSYFRSMQAVRKKVEALNREIEAELPRLVETLNYSLHDNRDLLAFFEKYRKVAGKAMSAEVDRLLVDLKTGNQEAALRSMDARLGIPAFTALCAILCGVHQGVDQRTSLLVLEQDIRAKERETLRRIMEKRPGRIKVASFILTVLLILMFMIPLILLIINNLQAVGF
ncbi:MAG: hypothetical protein ACOYU3_01090 [Bacillota bacterium]